MRFMKMDQMQKVVKYRFLNETAKKGEILFTGSSLMEQFPINELLMSLGMDTLIYNRGIGGFKTQDMLENMEEQVFGTEPSKIFINIGTNDMGMPDYKLEKLIENYQKILKQIKSRLPNTEVYVMAYYPVNEVDKIVEGGRNLFEKRNNMNIRLANTAIEDLAKTLDYHYIDVNEGLCDEYGRLKKEFTIEGVHIYSNAYCIILKNMQKYF